METRGLSLCHLVYIVQEYGTPIICRGRPAIAGGHFMEIQSFIMLVIWILLYSGVDFEGETFCQLSPSKISRGKSFASSGSLVYL